MVRYGTWYVSVEGGASNGGRVYSGTSDKDDNL